MSSSRFYLWLFITSVSSLTVCLWAVSGPNVELLLRASFLLIAFFIIFTLLIYIFSNQAIQSTNPYLFTRVFMISITLKFIFLAILVVLFVKLMAIKPRELLSPLLSSYLLFTIFETYVLIKLAKTK